VKYGFDAIEVPVSGTNDVFAAVQSLVGRCDVLLVPADNTVVSAFDSMVRAAVFASA
jgi:putative ABC transport system substrate-binding protein